MDNSDSADVPPHRYTAALARDIELVWQDRWEREGTFHAPNPTGRLSAGFGAAAERPRLYVADMFPYPSGAGLHVGHPLGYVGTDVYARYKRMTGCNVLHPMGFDAFGLPAEQYAVQTGQHPRVSVEAKIATMRGQLRRLGLGYDERRSFATTDAAFYRWTQWIFLQIFDAWYDQAADRSRPIVDLVEELDAGVRDPGSGTNPFGRPWAQLSVLERRQVVDNHRLAYVREALVNWCPGLGTVLANEEVTVDGRSERGNFPVYRRPLKQWMLRITVYADRLIADLDRVDWPEPIARMQRNWIGRSTGATIRFVTTAGPIEVFTTRPDTLFGATFLVVAPESPLVDDLVAAGWPSGTRPRWTGDAATPADAVAVYRRAVGRRSDRQRQAEAREMTGVFTGTYAVNPATGSRIPVFVADYVLMGYGTGAIMGVPGQDRRDWEFAERFALPVIRTVAPPAEFDGAAYSGDGPVINSGFLDGLDVTAAQERIVAWLADRRTGAAAVTYRLRDWLFSRQRYWGEPFPIVYDEHDLPIALPESMLPVTLPEIDDYAPVTSEEDSEPEPPLGRATEWVNVELDLGDGPRRYRRETNTMPQWAGSCWYELRYLDPCNDERFVDPEVESYWMGPRPQVRPDHPGGVDLYVGGVEHAVLHLLYSRFWHKVLHDLGFLSSAEPFYRLVNQGYVQAFAYQDARGFYVEAAEVEERDGRFVFHGRPVTRTYGKMGKSLKNSIAPEELYTVYGADTMRLYLMSTGPLDQDRPWDATAVVGVFRLLQRVWRNLIDEQTGTCRVDDQRPDRELRSLLHRTVAAVADTMETMRFNLAIARLTALNNEIGQRYPAGPVPREVAEPLVLMLAPLAPHIAEELWSRMGHPDSLTRTDYPAADPQLLAQQAVEVTIQINGKVRGHITLPPDTDITELTEAARTEPRIARLLAGQDVRRVVAIPGRLVNFVVA
jgi:leucyl-tRNA synthetase